jgi:hypothetical protein
MRLRSSCWFGSLADLGVLLICGAVLRLGVRVVFPPTIEFLSLSSKNFQFFRFCKEFVIGLQSLCSANLKDHSFRA